MSIHYLQLVTLVSVKQKETFNQTIGNIFHNFIPKKCILCDD